MYKRAGIDIKLITCRPETSFVGRLERSSLIPFLRPLCSYNANQLKRPPARSNATAFCEHISTHERGRGAQLTWTCNANMCLWHWPLRFDIVIWALFEDDKAHFRSFCEWRFLENTFCVNLTRKKNV